MADAEKLSSHFKALLICDTVDSTALVDQIGDRRWLELSKIHDEAARRLLAERSGLEIDKSDGFLLMFDTPIDAVQWALEYHEFLRTDPRLEQLIQSRVGIHFGEVYLVYNSPEEVERGAKPIEVEGLAKPMAARLMGLAMAGQTLMTRGGFDLARRSSVGSGAVPPDTEWMAHGRYQLKGVEETIDVFEVGIAPGAPLQPPADSAKAVRAISAAEKELLGWRPAPELEVPHRKQWFLKERLGEGGFGEVWLAAHRKTHETRTFKFCFDADRLKGLKREVTLFRLLREHLGDREDIAPVLEWNFEQAPFYLESNYTEGGSLTHWAESQGGLDAVSVETRLRLVCEIAEALSAAHSIGILHKDIKPSNVLVWEDKSGVPHARLTDFGIGAITDKKLLEDASMTVTGMDDETVSGSESAGRSGTRLYMAPEVLEGKPPTLQADVYALGVLLYQILAGDFRRAIATGWQEDIADEILREDVRVCTHGMPGKRLGSAQELSQRLETLGERREKAERERQEIADKEAALAALSRMRQRRRVVLAFGAFSAVFLVVLGFLYVRASQARKVAALRADEAERNLAIARTQGKGAAELITYVLQDLGEAITEELVEKRAYDREESDDIAREIGGKIAQPVVKYFADLETASWPETVQREHLERMGSVAKSLHELYRFDEALALRELAEKEYSRLSPQDKFLAANLAVTRGALLGDAGRPKEALEYYDGAAETLLNQSDRRAAILFHIGYIWAQIEAGETKQAFENSKTIDEAELLAEFGGDTHVITRYLNLMTNLSFRLGERKKSSDYNRRAVELVRRDFGEQSWSYANYIANVGFEMLDRGDIEESLRYYQESTNIYRKFEPSPDKDMRIANNLTSVSYVYQQQEQWEQAYESGLQALRLYQRILPYDHPTIIRTFSKLAWWRGKLESDDKSADEWIEEMALLIESRYGRDSIEYADVERHRASSAYRRKDMGAFVAHYQEVLKIVTNYEGPESNSVAGELMNIGYYLRIRGRVEDSIPLYWRGIEILEKNPIETQGDRDALEGAKMGLKIAEEALNEKRLSGEPIEPVSPIIIQLTTLNTSDTLRQIAEFPGAIDSLDDVEWLMANADRARTADNLDRYILDTDRAIEIYEKHHGEDSLQVAQLLLKIAFGYRSQGQVQLGLSLYKRALLIGEGMQDQSPEAREVTTSSLAGMAESYEELAEEIESEAARLGFTTQAADHTSSTTEIVEEWVAIADARFHEDVLKYAEIARRKGSESRKDGSFRGFEIRMQVALQICERELGPDHERTRELLGVLGYASRQNKRYAVALPYYQRLAASLERTTQGNPADASMLRNVQVSIRSIQSEMSEQGVGDAELPIPMNIESQIESLRAKASAARSNGDVDRYILIFEEMIALSGFERGINHPETAKLIGHLAYVCRSEGRLDKAFTLYEQAVEILENPKDGFEVDTQQLKSARIGLSLTSDAIRDAGATQELITAD